MVVVVQKLGVTKSRRDADYGIQNRIHGLFRVSIVNVYSAIMPVELF